MGQDQLREEERDTWVGDVTRHSLYPYILWGRGLEYPTGLIGSDPPPIPTSHPNLPLPNSTDLVSPFRQTSSSISTRDLLILHLSVPLPSVTSLLCLNPTESFTLHLHRTTLSSGET